MKTITLSNSEWRVRDKESWGFWNLARPGANHACTEYASMVRNLSLQNSDAVNQVWARDLGFWIEPQMRNGEMGFWNLARPGANYVWNQYASISLNGACRTPVPFIRSGPGIADLGLKIQIQDERCKIQDLGFWIEEGIVKNKKLAMSNGRENSRQLAMSDAKLAIGERGTGAKKHSGGVRHRGLGVSNRSDLSALSALELLDRGAINRW